MSDLRRPNTLALGQLRLSDEPGESWQAGLIGVEHIVLAIAESAETTRVVLTSGVDVVVNMPLERFMRRLSLDNPES